MSIYIYELWKCIYSIHFGYRYLKSFTFNLFLDTNRRGKKIREIKREQQWFKNESNGTQNQKLGIKAP